MFREYMIGVRSGFGKTKAVYTLGLISMAFIFHIKYKLVPYYHYYYNTMSHFISHTPIPLRKSKKLDLKG